MRAENEKAEERNMTAAYEGERRKAEKGPAATAESLLCHDQMKGSGHFRSYISMQQRNSEDVGGKNQP